MRLGVVYRFGSFSVCFLPDFLFLFPLPLCWLSVAVLLAFLLAFVLVLFGSFVWFWFFLPLCFSCCIIYLFFCILWAFSVFSFVLAVFPGCFLCLGVGFRYSSVVF